MKKYVLKRERQALFKRKQKMKTIQGRGEAILKAGESHSPRKAKRDLKINSNNLTRFK